MQHRGLAALVPLTARGRGSRPLALALTLGVAIAITAPAHAERGTVAGEVTLAPDSQRGAPPVRTLGFVARAQNPLKPAQAYDPRPYLIVVLEGGPGGSDRADRIQYRIEGSSFTRPIIPVQADVPFEIVNRSEFSPRLFAVGASDVLEGDPINPRGTRSATVSAPYTKVVIRDRDTAHIQGAVVAFPHPYFAAVGADGSFEIAGVPEGTYTAKIWYRDGWLNARTERVTVSAGGRARVQIAIPPRLEISAPEGDGAAE